MNILDKVDFRGRPRADIKIIVKSIELWRMDLTYKEISVITGVPVNTICHWVNDYYFPYMGDNKLNITLKSKV